MAFKPHSSFQAIAYRTNRIKHVVALTPSRSCASYIGC